MCSITGGRTALRPFFFLWSSVSWSIGQNQFLASQPTAPSALLNVCTCDCTQMILHAHSLEHSLLVCTDNAACVCVWVRGINPFCQGSRWGWGLCPVLQFKHTSLPLPLLPAHFSRSSILLLSPPSRIKHTSSTLTSEKVEMLTTIRTTCWTLSKNVNLNVLNSAVISVCATTVSPPPSFLPLTVSDEAVDHFLLYWFCGVIHWI